MAAAPAILAATLLGVASAAPTAHAEEPASRVLRLVGDAAAAKDPAPRRFVIDAVVKPGEDFQATLEGWFAEVGADDPLIGALEGGCVEKRCTLGVDLEGGKFSVVGDFGEAEGPVQARFVVKDSEGSVSQQGQVVLTPVKGPVPDLGELAPSGAVDAAELDDLLMWNGSTLGFGGHDKGEPPSDFQRSTVADWQAAQGRKGGGLLLTADLAELRSGAAAAKKAAGWTLLDGHGWSAGYPASVLPKSSGGAERRFQSADGKAELVIALDPPMSDEAFGRFVEETSADREGRSDVSYTRVNDDMEISYHQGGKAFAEAYHNRADALARLVFSYPVDEEDTYGRYAGILQRSLFVTDDLKR